MMRIFVAASMAMFVRWCSVDVVGAVVAAERPATRPYDLAIRMDVRTST